MTHDKTYDRLWNMLTRWPVVRCLSKWSPLIYFKICGSIRRRFEMSHGDGRFSRDKIQHSVGCRYFNMAKWLVHRKSGRPKQVAVHPRDRRWQVLLYCDGRQQRLLVQLYISGTFSHHFGETSITHSILRRNDFHKATEGQLAS